MRSKSFHSHQQATTVRLNERSRVDSQALARVSGRFGLVPT
jgi:hypothetical protein